MTDFSNQTHQGLLSQYDIYLLAQGKHWESYDKMGAQVCCVNGVNGVNFVLWAPNADEVSVIGDFNGWDRTVHYMWKYQSPGLWEIFIPGLKAGMLYKYSLRVGNEIYEKCDPYAFASECPPRTANRIVDKDAYTWHDTIWQEKKHHFDWQHAPMTIYEVHLGSWQNDFLGSDRWLNYRDIADRLVPYLKQMHFTHVEFMPVCEHPLTGSWGYQVMGYYAPTARYGSPEDFMYMVDQFHQNGIGVILDWVPAHFPKDELGLGRFDKTALYEHADPRQGEHSDWGTYIFNFGRNEVRNFLISNVLYWAKRFHIDGVRVDAVASMLYLDYSRSEDQWVPNKYGGRENIEAIEFLREMNHELLSQCPGVVTIAEESTAWPGVTRPSETGGLGFCMKWNMGWMHDTLAYMNEDPLFRKYHHDQLTFSLLYAFNENFVLPFSHDEVVHCKGSMIGRMPGDTWRKFANLRLLYAYQWTHPGKKLIFMGDEIAQWDEWDFNSQIQWNLLQHETHRGVQQCVSDLCALYKNTPALYELDFDAGGFEWIDCSNRDCSTLSFLRKARDPRDYLVVVCNFTPVTRDNFWVGVPESGEFKEIFNSDSARYAGSDVRNDIVNATLVPCQGQPASIQITLPPLGVSIFQPMRQAKIPSYTHRALKSPF
ncbi:MAG: 1,4-alpha-glucan branching protein GlgB [Planctomycetia bacterium]|nr:1,4-alpha-glucan branching protein GlgB [Planctomycetia bacterium]